MRYRFGEHGLAAAGGTVEKDSRGSGEEGRSGSVEMRHGKGVDDGLLELRDDGSEPADVVECHRDVLRSNNVHGDCLLIIGKDQVMFVRAMSGGRGGRGVVFIGGRGTVKAAEDSGGG